eukprot:5414356-Prymnesium_polylepis.1
MGGLAPPYAIAIAVLAALLVGRGRSSALTQFSSCGSQRVPSTRAPPNHRVAQRPTATATMATRRTTSSSWKCA